MVSATVFTVIAWAIIAVVLWPIYRDPAFIVLAVISIAVAVALALVAARAQWPAWGTVLAAVSAFIVLGVPLAVPSRTVYGVLPEPAGLLDLVAGVALGWRQLVTIDLPVGAYQALLVPAFVLLLVGPLLTLTLAVRTVRGELAAIVPLAVFPLAVALGPQQPLLPISTAIALATTLLLWMAVWRRHRRSAAVGAAGAADSRWLGARALAAGVALLLVAGGVGAATVAVAPP
ncbi:MAG: transglutaminase domain-containing protein, partial [Microcella sp.]